MNILAFFAHPDDETMFCGGTLAYLARGGADVHYLSATRGEGGELGDPPVCRREELGRVREQELRCAVEALGGRGVDFLDYADPLVGPDNELFPFTDDLDRLCKELAERLSILRPEAVITHGPGGEYGHPAHILAHRGLVGSAASLSEDSPAVYAVYRERDQDYRPEEGHGADPDYMLDVTHTREQKIRAVRCHRSQHGLFLRNASRRAGRRLDLEELVSDREGLVQVQIPGKRGIEDPLYPLLQEITVH